MSEICAICIQDFFPVQMIHITECAHIFHKECVDIMLLHRHNCCPVCRANIIINNDSEKNLDIFNSLLESILESMRVHNQNQLVVNCNNNNYYNYTNTKIRI